MNDDIILAFGPFALHARQRVLLRGADPLKLTPKEIDVLCALVARPGELVDKRELFDEVWRGVNVEDCNLAQHVAALRRVLGDDARVPTFIETVPRRGYRFVAPVTRTAAPVSTPAPTPAEPTPPQPGPALPPPDAASMAPAPSAEPAAGVRPPRARAVRWRVLTLAGLATLGTVSGIWRTTTRSAPPPAVSRSVALLPIANLTGDTHQDELAATLTAALAENLRRAGMRVVPIAPAQENERVDGADGLVETAILGGAGDVQLAAELMDGSTRRLLWAELIESSEVSFVDASERIARTVASRLAAPDTAAQDRPARDRAAAHREAALAQEYLDRRTAHVAGEALEHFLAAARLDPEYVPAQVGIAEAYLLGAEERVLSPAKALAGAETAARRALELAPGLAQAHAALGQITAARWDFETATAEYRRAIEIDPALAMIHARYAMQLTVEDRHAEAIAEARVARDLDPRSPAVATNLAATYLHAGHPDAAIDHALAALRLAPGFAAAYDVLGWAHHAAHRDAEAAAAFREAVRLSGRSPAYVAALARAEARAGHREQARLLLGELERSAPDRAASPLDLAEVLAALGEPERALRQVERAAAEGTPWLQHVDGGLGFAALHDHAGFRELVRRMHDAATARSVAGVEPTKLVGPPSSRVTSNALAD